MEIALRSILRATGRRHDIRLQQLPPVAQFRRMLLRGRARGDRMGEGFSLLVFGVPNRKCEYDVFSRLADRFPQRLRGADQPGWLDSHHLAVIMPVAPSERAWLLADTLCADLPADLPRPECEVYVYPVDRKGPEQPERPENGTPQEQRGVTASRPAGAAYHSMLLVFAQPLPIWKRTTDLLVAGTALALLTPLFMIIAVAIRLSSRGPVFFSQLRSGLGGKPFRMYKFRTMVTNAESLKQELLEYNMRDGPAFKLAADPRVFRMGRWLRATSLDELPQLWNVLRGEMSLVGPRPLPCDESDACRGWRSHRLDVTPGLTCTWQTEKTRDTSFDEWMRMDARYTRSVSFWTDFKLLFKTIPVVVLRRNE